MSKHYSQKRDQKRYNVPYSIIEFFSFFFTLPYSFVKCFGKLSVICCTLFAIFVGKKKKKKVLSGLGWG